MTDGVLQINPVSLVTASRYQSDKSEAESSYVVDPLSPAEVDALLAAAGNKQWENLFRFAIHTGLRSSELCALRWHDIDFVGKTAHVQSASVVGVIKGTKTKAGTRKVELTEEAMLALINQKPFTFMKDATVFEDPKTNKPWQVLMQLGKSMGANIAKSRYSLQKPISNQAYIRHQPYQPGANLFLACGSNGP